MAHITEEAQHPVSARSSDGGQVDDISDHVTRMDIDSAAQTPVAAPAATIGGHTEGIDLYDDDYAKQADGGRGGTGDVSDVDAPAIRDATDQRTSDETTEGPNDVCAAFCARMFKPALAPILPRPDSPPPPPLTSRRGRRKAPAAATRSSTRLVARPSVPVAERAQHKLMRELSFIDGKSVAPDAAVTAYVDMYGDDLPEQAIKAIRAATRLENKELSRALAAIAAELGAAEMEVP
jgi:hypothetical protein